MLVATEKNPVPENMRTGQLSVSGKGHLRYALLKATSMKRKGTIILLQGRNESIEKYFETAENLRKNGFTIVNFDWRGQGGSSRFLNDRNKGYVGSVRQYQEDLENIFERIVLPECQGPYFIVSHSTGSLVSLYAAPKLINRISRIVLLAPFLGMANRPLSTATIGYMATALKWIGLGRMYMSGGLAQKTPRPFKKNVLTTDPARYARNVEIHEKAPHLFLGGPTVSWVSAVARAIKKVSHERFLERLHLPILIITAGQDVVVDNEMTRQAATMIPSAKVIQIDGARHELLQEKDYYREQVLAAILAFLPGSDTVVPQKTSLD